MFYSLHSAHRCGRGLHAGFTLIELLVVVLIIGILAAVALPQYHKSVQRARWAQLVTAGAALKSAAERYYMANSAWPEDFRNLDIQIQGNYSVDNNFVSFNGYSCGLLGDLSASTLSTLCTTQKGGFYMGYRLFYSGSGYSKSGYCVAVKDNVQGNAFCASLGGKDPFNNGSDLMHYRLD